MLNGKRIYKVTNGVREEITAPEYEQAKADLLSIEAEKQKIENANTDKETKKASGKQKLLDLGLTEEEVEALIGV